mgnify:CR=1 FL=1
MQRNSNSKLFPLLVTVIVIVIVIVALISIGRAIFKGASQDEAAEQIDGGRTALLDSSNGSSVSLTVRGPIVAEENFKSYRVVVSPASRSLTVHKGYLEAVQQSRDLDNNKTAYEQFVYALDKANMMKGVASEEDATSSLRGICATGYVYEYAVLSGGTPVKHLWTSTCDGSKGTLNASTKQLNNLFLNQIPDAEKILPFGNTGLRLSL